MARNSENIDFHVDDLVIAAVFTGLFVLALFIPFWLRGQSIYFTVIEEGFPVAANYPWDTFAAQSIVRGHFPLWNPYSSGGTVFLANWLEAFFFFPRWFLYLSPSAVIRDFYVLLRFWLGGIFLFMFIRRLGFKNYGAMVGVACFLGAGYFTRFYNENYLSIELFLGLWLLAADKLATERKIGSVLLCSLAIAGIIFAGHPTAGFHTLLLMGFYIIFRTRRKAPKVFPLFIVAGIIAGLIASVQLLTFTESWVFSKNCHIPNLGRVHYELRHLATLAFPWIYGNLNAFLDTHDLSRVIGGVTYSQTTINWLPYYFGAAQLMVASISFIAIKKLDRMVIFFLVYLIVALGIVFGIQPFNFITAIGVLSEIGNYKHLFPSMVLSLSVLAGAGIEHVVYMGPRGSLRLILPGAAALVVLGAYATWKNPYSARYLHLALGGILPMAVVLGSMASRNRAVRTLVPLAAIAATAMAYPVGYRYLNQGYVRTMDALPYIKYLQANADEGLFTSLYPPFFPNLGTIYGLSDIRGLDALQPKPYWRMLLHVNSCDEATMHRHFLTAGVIGPMSERIDDPELRKKGLMFIVSPGDLGGIVTVRSLVRTATVHAPEPINFHWSVWDIDGDKRPVILTHPPLLVEIPADNPAERYDIESAVAYNPMTPEGTDGSFITIYDWTPESRKIVYSRHLDLAGKGWIAMPELPARAPGSNRFILVHPGDSASRDWLGMGFRSRSGSYAGFDMALKGPVSVYKSREPFRKAIMTDVNGVELTPDPRVHMRFNDEYVIETTADEGTVKLNFLNYRPGWKAFGPGGETKIIHGDTVNYRGESDLLLLKYVPYSFKIGLWTTLTSLLFFMAALLSPIGDAGRRRKKKSSSRKSSKSKRASQSW